MKRRLQEWLLRQVIRVHAWIAWLSWWFAEQILPMDHVLKEIHAALDSGDVDFLFAIRKHVMWFQQFRFNHALYARATYLVQYIDQIARAQNLEAPV